MKAPINALSREERTRMLRLAMQAEPQPLGFAVEIALTTGMRRGEVCALRWSDLSDDGTITVSHALGKRSGRLLREGAQDRELRQDNPPHQAPEHDALR